MRDNKEGLVVTRILTNKSQSAPSKYKIASPTSRAVMLCGEKGDNGKSGSGIFFSCFLCFFLTWKFAKISSRFSSMVVEFWTVCELWYTSASYRTLRISQIAGYAVDIERSLKMFYPQLSNVLCEKSVGELIFE